MSTMPEGDETNISNRYVNCLPVTTDEDVSTKNIYECKQHPVQSFQQFAKYRLCDSLCDVTIEVGSKSLRAHRVVLAASSPYFHAMFTSGLREGTAGVIQLHDVDAESVVLLVEFIYSSKIKIVETNVQQLLAASNLLQLTYVRDACCSFLKRQLDPCNALGILLFADTHHCHELVKTAESYVLQHFVKVSKTEEFLTLRIDRIKFLLSSDDLIVEEEHEIFTALINWVKFDIENRKQYTHQLLSLVRLPLLNRDFLMLTVEVEDLVKHNSLCKDLLIEAMKYHLMPEMRRYLQTSRTKVREGEFLKPIIYTLGGQSLFAIHCECEFYADSSDVWQLIQPMTVRRARLGIGVVYDKLYAIGGFDGCQDLNTVEVYNPKSNVWSSGLQMGTNRSCLGVAVLHNLLYAIGGYDGSSCLNSVERYDPLSNQWTSVAKMNGKRRYVSVGVIDEHIIAAGGYDGNQHLNTCEIYDPVSNIWTTKSGMKCQRSSAGGCVLNNHFYVSGGTDGGLIMQSVERYDIMTDTWTDVHPLTSIRMTHALIPYKDMLLAIGGSDGTTSLNSVEEYDPISDTWVLKMSMTTRRSHVAASVMMARSSR